MPERSIINPNPDRSALSKGRSGVLLESSNEEPARSHERVLARNLERILDRAEMFRFRRLPNAEAKPLLRKVVARAPTKWWQDRLFHWYFNVDSIDMQPMFYLEIETLVSSTVEGQILEDAKRELPPTVATMEDVEQLLPAGFEEAELLALLEGTSVDKTCPDCWGEGTAGSKERGQDLTRRHGDTEGGNARHSEEPATKQSHHTEEIQGQVSHGDHGEHGGGNARHSEELATKQSHHTEEIQGQDLTRRHGDTEGGNARHSEEPTRFVMARSASDVAISSHGGDAGTESHTEHTGSTEGGNARHSEEPATKQSHDTESVEKTRGMELAPARSQMTEPCPRCQGRGKVRRHSTATLRTSIQREIHPIYPVGHLWNLPVPREVRDKGTPECEGVLHVRRPEPGVGNPDRPRPPTMELRDWTVNPGGLLAGMEQGGREVIDGLSSMFAGRCIDPAFLRGGKPWRLRFRMVSLPVYLVFGWNWGKLLQVYLLPEVDLAVLVNPLRSRLLMALPPLLLLALVLALLA